MKTSCSIFLIGILLVVFATSCKKESDYLYEVNPVTVTQSGSGKNTPKSTAEFITIAWADLFGTQVTQQDLVKLNTVYVAFGDKKLIEDRILLNMLTKPGLLIPAVPNVGGDTLKFVVDTYKKLYNREPNAFEQYYLKEQIRLNSAMTPRVIWYALMTSDEYRYY